MDRRRLGVLRVSALCSAVVAVGLALGTCVAPAPAPLPAPLVMQPVVPPSAPARLPLASRTAAACPSTYDRVIKRANEEFLLSPWLLLKAQFCAESNLKSDAVSPVGAAGIAQFMPTTAAEVWRKVGYVDVDRADVEQSARAGAYYMAQLKQRRVKRFTELERHYIACADYNAGMGNVDRAVRLAGEPKTWAEVLSTLPMVTGKRSEETEGYVRRIKRYYADLAAAS